MGKGMFGKFWCAAFIAAALAALPSHAQEAHRFTPQEVELIKEAAARGGFKAQALLGTLYYYGNGVEMDDALAVKWWTKAAQQGNRNAQYDLGMAYHDGRGGLKQSDRKAVEWFRKGAQQGEVRSQYNLGIALYNGLGVTKDKAQAMQWFEKAAQQGNADAQYILAAGYKDGIGGLPEDNALSYVWVSRAKNNGHREAARDVEGVEKILTLEEKARATSMLTEKDR
jgi:TPR repeat protein